MDPPARRHDRGDERPGRGRVRHAAHDEPALAVAARPGRRHRAGRRRVGRSVTRSRTAVSPSRSVSGPAATTRPRLHDRDPVAQPLHLAQEVRVEEHGRAARLRLADDRPHVVAADRVERGRRLVEDHERRVAEERGREAEALLHALREAGRPVAAAVREADERRGHGRSRRVRRPALGRPARLRVELEHLAGREPRLVAEQLRAGSRCARRASRSPSGAAEDRAARRRRAGEAEEQLDRGRLAGAVGTEEPEHLARARRGCRGPRGRRSCRRPCAGHGSRSQGSSRDDCRAAVALRVQVVTA